MRKIKFRCWYEGKMYEVFSYNISDKSVDISLPRFPFSQHVYPDNIMQYTGLKDKNGKETYEGDIICVDEISIYDTINAVMQWREWESENYWMKVKAGWRLVGINGPVRQIWTEETIEIIGNIHENPELINNP